MSSVQTVYIQYTQLKRAVNPPRKKNGGGGSGRAGRRSKKADGVCSPRLRVCRAVPPGMTVSAPPQCAYSRAARVCLRAAMGANQRTAPPGMLILVCRPRACGFAPAPSRTLQAQALPPARLRVRPSASETVRTRCPAARALAGLPRRPGVPSGGHGRQSARRAARYAYFGLPPALAAALRRPECLLQPCRPRLRVRRAARYAYFGPAAPPGGARKHPGSWPLITPAACRKA